MIITMQKKYLCPRYRKGHGSAKSTGLGKFMKASAKTIMSLEWLGTPVASTQNVLKPILMWTASFVFLPLIKKQVACFTLMIPL